MLANKISPKTHGIIDYIYAGSLIAGPYLFGFNKKDKTATTLSLIEGFSHLGLSLFTKYPTGLIKAVPFKTHGVIETAAASFLALSPLFIKNRTRRATLFLTIAGLSAVGLSMMTNYGGVPKTVKAEKTTKDRVAA